MKRIFAPLAFLLIAFAANAQGIYNPQNDASKLTTGTLPAARLPNPSASTLGGVQSLTCAANQWLNTVSTSGVPACAQPNFSNLATGTAPAFTLGGTVSGGGNQINNVVIGASTPLAGSFTTITASSTSTLTGNVGIGGASSTQPLKVLGITDIYAGYFTNTSSASHSFGLLVDAGNDSSDRALLVRNASASANLLFVSGDGFVTIPTGSLRVGNATATTSAGELSLSKISASGSAPGAGSLKISAVAGTNAGTCKIIAYAGTSTTPVTLVDNVGAGC